MHVVSNVPYRYLIGCCHQRTYSALRSFLPFRLRLSSYNVPSALFASKLGFMPDPDVDMSASCSGRDFQTH